MYGIAVIICHIKRCISLPRLGGGGVGRETFCYFTLTLKGTVSTSTSYFFSIFILSADYFLSSAHPKGKHPWLSKNVWIHPGKSPYAWEQNRAIFWSLVYTKCSQVGSLQPPGQVINLKSFIYRKFVALQIIHEAWRMLWDCLVACTPMETNTASIDQCCETKISNFEKLMCPIFSQTFGPLELKLSQIFTWVVITLGLPQKYF